VLLKRAKMDRGACKKLKVSADGAAKTAIRQLVYDFLRRDKETCEIAELLKKKTKLVTIFRWLLLHVVLC